VILRLDAEKTGRWLLKVEVADTGIGIASDDQERIFRPFVQLENGHSGGTGLGLSLTRQYVEIMGGTITVESAPGQGSVFRVSLPAEVAEAVQPDRDAPRVIGLAPGQPRFRILIVEDDEENQNLLAELLKRAGFQVKSVGDGAAAVRAFRSWQPHFIWMDWRLPLMDGEQATKAIRVMAAGRRVKIAAVAASASSEERAAILAAGVDEFVRKPFRPQHVFECMTRLLGVRYIYDERWIPAQVNGEAVLTPETLRVLPERLRQELGDAVISLDVNRVTGAIRRAYDLDREIGAALSRHANSLGFTAILKALEASREREGKEAR